MKDSLAILGFRFDIDDAEQERKDSYMHAMLKFTAQKKRRDFLKRFLPLKEVFETALSKRKTGACVLQKTASKSSGFSLLTKNALQNVVQFFRPWGRDFTVLRLVNKRVQAAYTDHLKSTVNIGVYLKTVEKRAFEENCT